MLQLSLIQSISAFFIKFADRIRPDLTTAKLCVTGGFRSVAGMAKAVREKSCDLVGLARPLTAEPHLCKTLLEEKAPAAKENRVPGPLQTASSNIQIVQIGKGEPLSDLSVQEVADSTVALIMGSAYWFCDGERGLALTCLPSQCRTPSSPRSERTIRSLRVGNGLQN